MKKTSKRDKINLLFSAFLIIAFVICGYFFSALAQTLASPWNRIITILVFVLFGLILFYATRVGEGKQVMRFSLSSLILVVLPTLYIIIASMNSHLPLYEQLSGNQTIVLLAGAALGYGLPYTFLSGFELKDEEPVEADGEETEEEENAETLDIEETAQTGETEETEETEETQTEESIEDEESVTDADNGEISEENNYDNSEEEAAE